MPKTFSEAVNDWWKKFDAMKPGTAYEIARCSKKPQMFVEVCKDYIHISPNGDEYTLSDDYVFFKRKPKPEIPLWEQFYHQMEELPSGIRVEKIEKGTIEFVQASGQRIQVVHQGERGKPYVPSYKVYDGDKLIAIEVQQKSPE